MKREKKKCNPNKFYVLVKKRKKKNEKDEEKYGQKKMSKRISNP